MSKRKRSPQNRPARRPKQRRPRPAPARRREPGLLDEVADRLADPSPLPLLGYVSGLLNAVDPRNRSPFARDEPEVSIDDLVVTFVEMRSRETSALLTVIAAMTGDDLLRARIRRELATRHDALPDWLTQLSTAAPVEPVQMTEVLGDGENVVVGVSLAGRSTITVSVYIDHNLGRVAKDAYPMDVGPEEVRAVAESAPASDDVSITTIDGADARARITEAIAAGSRTFPPYETDTWPACRPLVEWLCGRLPAGGPGFEVREWSSAEDEAVTALFLDSPHGAPFRDDPDARDAVGHLVWYGTGYSTLDPFRWGVPKLEVLMLDWLPRKIIDTPSSLARYPSVLRAFVAFGHSHVGVPERFTQQALAAIDDFEPEYLELIADSDRPQGVHALFDAMGLSFDPDGDDDLLPAIDAEVGGPGALLRLDAAPLPDEPFDDEGLGAPVLERLAPILELVDGIVTDVFGVEARTACRRLARRVALADPRVVTRGKRDEVTAAALCWLVAGANDLFRSESVQVKDVLARFGVTGSVSQRAEAVRSALGLPYATRSLGSADLLVSGYRERLCALRDGC